MIRGPVSHPLDKLIKDDKLIMLEAMIPFVDQRMKAPLALYIKITELKLIMAAFTDRNYVSKCGLDLDMNNKEQVLSALSGCGFPDIASQFENIKKAMDMANLMSMMSEADSPPPHDAQPDWGNPPPHDAQPNWGNPPPHDAQPDWDNPPPHDEEMRFHNASNSNPADMMDSIMDMLAEYDHTHDFHE